MQYFGRSFYHQNAFPILSMSQDVFRSAAG